MINRKIIGDLFNSALFSQKTFETMFHVFLRIIVTNAFWIKISLPLNNYFFSLYLLRFIFFLGLKLLHLYHTINSFNVALSFINEVLFTFLKENNN